MTIQKLQSINPSDYQLLGEVDISNLQEIREKVEAARKAQKGWANLGIERRVKLLRNAIEEFESRQAEFTLLESREMGIPVKEANSDFTARVKYAKWNFDNAARYLKPETTFENDKVINQVFYEPIGVSAVIIPWNFPWLNFIWGSLQNLIAGNAIVLKHSEECPLCGKFIEDVFSRHLPNGVFNEVYGDGEIGKLLVQQDIDMIAFTGSTKTGRLLYETAGKKFIKAVMELGGSAPGIIFDDANINLSIKDACGQRLSNAGQCCDGLKRLIVQSDIFDEVVQSVVSVFSAKKIGAAEEESTDIGPLVAKRQLDLLISQVEDAKAKGAKVITGGNSLEAEMNGAFYEPTILTGITDEMRVWKEEVFGPVLPIVSFETEEEAIELANQTVYGLGAYVYTGDKGKADRVASSIKTGMVSINGTSYTAPFNPFGGYKSSGIGREHGKYGFHEVTQVKIVAKNR
ncbi:aldehyde dehydrogenase family protein [Chloroflexota bacterium]